MIEDKDFKLSNEQDNFVIYNAGDEAKAKNGDKVLDADFSFVQQDKKIHDVKFTTKPTTFFKDAMARFAKNKASVAASVILGILILAAIIIPIDGVLGFNFNISSTNTLEMNLPPKIADAGSGFWDGTKLYENTPYPYDDNGPDDPNHENSKYIGTLSIDESVIVGGRKEGIRNFRKAYQDTSAEDGFGGYLTIESKPYDTSKESYLLNSGYKFNFDNDYTATYSLGWKDKENYTKPEYALYFSYKYLDTASNSNVEKRIALTSWSSDYGIEASKEDEDETVTPYQSISVNITPLVKEKVPNYADIIGASRIGLAFKSDTAKNTILYIDNFTLTSSNSSENTGLAEQSFTDANAVLVYNGKEGNKPVWASNSDRFSIADCRVKRCDILYDMYKINYGYKSGVKVAGAVFDEWQEKGYITGWDKNSNNPTFTVTPQGKPYVYVNSVTSVAAGTENENVYTCIVLVWKQLGYSSMPIHIFGTDKFGKDVLKYTFAGLRTSLILGFIVSAINIVIGVVWGSITGYFGGKLDLFLERFVDILSGIPWIVLMTVLVLNLGQTFFVFALALCLTGWIGIESVTRSQFYRFKGREYVLAARTLGAKSPRLIFKHILPNAIGTIVTNAVLMIPSVIFSEATISYLGLGLKNLASLGVILSDNQTNLGSYPYQLAVPAVIISLLMICFNLFGNGLRDAFNPSLKGSD